MKKINNFLWGMLFFTASYAQTIPADENISLDLQLLNISQTSVTSGIIYERVISSANLYNFNKVSTFNTANFPYFKQAFSEMRRASNNTKFMSLDAFKNLVKVNTTPNEVDVAILNTQFHILNFNEDNPSAGGLNYNSSSKKFESITNKVPFYMLHNTVIAPTKEHVSGTNVVFKLRNDIYFKNGTKTIKTLIANFGDGINRTLISNFILTNQNITVNYNSSGDKISTFTITYNDNSTLTTYGKIYFQYSPLITSLTTSTSSTASSCTGLDPLKQDFELHSDIPFTGYNIGDPTIKSKIDYRIFYAFAHTDKRLRKPIIIIDGFDPGDKRKIQDCDCENIPGCAARNTSGGVFDPQKHRAMVDLMEYYEGSDKRELLIKLRSEGYDVVMVNHPTYETTNLQNGQKVKIDGGAYYIESNAMALIKLLQQTKILLNISGSKNQIAIVAPSMAGQISRYALSYMEKKYVETNDPVWNHNTSLWISVDSPHLGANIPMGDQALLYLLKEGGIDAASDFYDNELSSPAAQQQLIELHKAGENYHNVNQDMQNAQTITQNMQYNRGSSLFQQHYNNQNTNGLPNSNGWPQNLRKISIVNGSLTGSKQTQMINGNPFIPFANDGENIFNLRGFQRVNINLPWPLGSITFRTHIASLEVHNMPSYGTEARVSRFKKLFNDKTTITKNINPRGCMDNVPGGFFDAQADIADEVNSEDPVPGITLTSLKNWNLGNFSIENIFKSISEIIGGSEWYQHAYNPIHSFIPSFSALGHLQPNQNWSNELSTNLVCSSNKLTPFDSYFGLEKNTQHTSFTKESVDWLIKELAGQPQAPHFPIQENALSGPNSFCTTATYSFADICKIPSAVTWSVSDNLQIVSQTSTSIAVSKIIDGSGSITATFQNGQTVKRTLWIGKPSINLEYNYFDPQPIKSTVCVTSDIPKVSLAQQGVTNVSYKVCNTNSVINFSQSYCMMPRNNCCFEFTATNSCGSTTVVYNCMLNRQGDTPKYYIIYPNPSNDIVNIDIRDQDQVPNKDVLVAGELFDMMGQSKAKVEIVNNKATFSVRGLNKGIYVLKIYINDQIETHQVGVE